MKGKIQGKIHGVEGHYDPTASLWRGLQHVLYALVLLAMLAFLCGVLYEAHALLWWFAGLLTQLVGRFDVHVETDWRGVAVCAVSAVLVVYVWRAPAS